MQQKISFFTIGVHNLEAMTHFYKQTFGWVPMKESDGISFFKLNDFLFGLYPVDELAEDVGVATGSNNGFKGFTMAMNCRSVAEVDTLFASLVSKGATAVKQPEKVFWGGYRGYIADLENNYWELAFNPFLEMDEEGNVVQHS